MMKTNNPLIENWQKTAKMVYEAETLYLQTTKKDEKEREYTYSYLAKKQIDLIDETRPNKDLPLEAQITEEQKETIEYLLKVYKTNEL